VINQAKVRYKVDLKRYMADCDANYVRLLKLFPAMVQEAECESERKIGICHGVDRVLCLRVLEQTPYTTLIRLSQDGADDNPVQRFYGWLTLPVLTLRLYHDARVAEVVSCEGSRRAFPRYEYPNERMYHQDEKAQWNQFLSEWLAYCLEHGYEVEPSFGETS
jgi:uncharacterized protein YqiB (DUF1249 family)